jgi:hypothetical protein
VAVLKKTQNYGWSAQNNNYDLEKIVEWSGTHLKIMSASASQFPSIPQKES